MAELPHASRWLLLRVPDSGTARHVPPPDRMPCPLRTQLSPSLHPKAALSDTVGQTPVRPDNPLRRESALQAESLRPSTRPDSRYHPTSRDANRQSGPPDKESARAP